MPDEFDLGWYHIDETWNLYVDGDLSKVHVDFIEVDESPEENGADYVVNHYDKSGDLLTSVHLDAGDIAPELRDREPTDRPMHI